MLELSISRIAQNLEILHTELRMLRIVVMALSETISPKARDCAIELIKDAATAEPRFALNLVGDELGRRIITESASAWIQTLSPPIDPVPTSAAPE